MNKRTWLHFVGKSYYSIEEFIAEAKDQGVSRAVAPNVLRQMEFGDIVVLAQGDRKGSTIFGFFVIDTMIGFNSEFLRQAADAGAIESHDGPRIEVERGCGSYTIFGTATVENREKLSDLIKNAKDEDLGRVMIGGRFIEYERYIETQIPFRMGFRRFDYDLFKETADAFMAKYPERKQVKVKGYFYVFEEGDEQTSYEIAHPLIFMIEKYQLN